MKLEEPGTTVMESALDLLEHQGQPNVLEEVWDEILGRVRYAMRRHLWDLVQRSIWNSVWEPVEVQDET